MNAITQIAEDTISVVAVRIARLLRPNQPQTVMEMTR
ncbi:hypothetical protein Atc_2406 [Acidithiobacillus caldus SM-1]|uniref:Uncharacterized protein n=1 Tax=Acidithiobacillus caldus (strain SM-1) TaxID=990288 RepID=F9ZS75_ACICS|nr:hypothetical protein Atc_2406 [Acidithiobacillus caldus SM-1]